MLKKARRYRHIDGAAELDALLDAAVDAIVLCDSQGSIIGFNPAAEKLFGYSQDEIVDQPLTVLMPESDRSAHDAHVRRYLETREAHILGIGREVLAQKRSGETFPIWLTVGEAEEGQNRSFVGIIRDLSEQRAAERERYALEAKLAHVGKFSLMGEMAAGIAHEINQPLAAIATYSEAVGRLLAQGTLDADSIAQACSSIASQARRASQVIENLRNLIRRQDERRERLDLNRVIRDVMTLVEADAKAAGVAVRVQYAPGLGGVYGHVVQLQQVLLNLTRNAVDAMEDSTRKSEGIEIETAGNDECVQFSVRDRGPGVSPRLAQDVFHPFVTTKRDGLGVGLAISRTIVEAHGGELMYRDNPEGGAVFTAIFPISEGDELE